MVRGTVLTAVMDQRRWSLRAVSEQLPDTQMCTRASKRHPSRWRGDTATNTESRHLCLPGDFLRLTRERTDLGQAIRPLWTCTTRLHPCLWDAGHNTGEGSERECHSYNLLEFYSWCFMDTVCILRLTRLAFYGLVFYPNCKHLEGRTRWRNPL